MDKQVGRSILIGGFAAVVAGLWFMFTPARGLSTLVVLFGVFAVAEGFSTVVGGLRHRETTGRLQGIEGVLSLAAGLLLILRPEVGGRFLIWVIGAWAVAVGATEVVQGGLERRSDRLAWVLAASGAFTLIFGLSLVLGRATSVIALRWLLGLYLLAWGCVRAAYGVALRTRAAGESSA